MRSPFAALTLPRLLAQLLCFSAILVVSLGIASAVRAAEHPAAFVQQVGAQATAVVADPTLTPSQRQAAYRRMLEAYFDLDLIAKVVLGRHWRRATPAGAWAATLVSFGVLLSTSRLEIFGRVLYDFNALWAHRLPDWMLWDGQLYLPWQMILYLLAGLLTMILVSLKTRPVAPEKLDRVYTCLRTPVLPGEPETEPFTLPDGIDPAPRRPLIQHPDFEIPRPGAVAIAGFLATWIIVLILVGVFYWILN